MAESFDNAFPALGNVDSKKTSEIDFRYNCIAWAFGDNRRFWWPSERTFWPLDFRGKTNMEAFIDLFEQDGWTETDNLAVEPDVTKIALYAINGEPTHAARLLDSGFWTSKLGSNIDISHGYNDLNGPTYGSVVSIFRK